MEAKRSRPRAREHSRRTAEYLLGLPLLGDYLEDGLAMFDEGIVDDADTREGLNAEDEPLGNMPDKPAAAIIRFVMAHHPSPREARPKCKLRVGHPGQICRSRKMI